jgi:hypothetical protein
MDEGVEDLILKTWDATGEIANFCLNDARPKFVIHAWPAA